MIVARMPPAVQGLKLAGIRGPGGDGNASSSTASTSASTSGSRVGSLRAQGCFSSGGGGGGTPRRGSASAGIQSNPPKPIRGRGRAAATTTQDLRNKKEVLGYAAVAALRRSAEQGSSASDCSPGGKAGERVWLSGKGKTRPRSEPAGSPDNIIQGTGGLSSSKSITCGLEAPTSRFMDSWIPDEKELKKPPSLLVFSGGTAFNGAVEELKKLTTNVTHVLPVSDDGGSTSEILRVLGGPALGDIRSRCLRLSDESSAEALAVKRLLGYRLPVNSSEAKAEWYKIIEGEHELWTDVSGPYRETIRAFLVYFQSQILMNSSKRFSFSNGSIGNFFFAGARIFIQSLDSAIFLYSRVSRIPADSVVTPAICTNDRVTLGCELYDGTFVRGQNEISHPIKRNLVGECESSNVVDKGRNSTPPLPSPIKRIFYMSPDGTNASHEVFPVVNTEVLKRAGEVDALVYGMGSLYTSICPLLVLRGVGEAIAKQTCPKILLLNGSHDRETAGMTASDFIISICDALNRKYGDPNHALDYPPTSFVNTLLVPEKGAIPVYRNQLADLGVNQVVVVDSIEDENTGVIFDPKSLITCIERAISKKADCSI